MEDNIAILKELLALLENKDYRLLKERLAEINPADAAEYLEILPEKARLMVFRSLGKVVAANTFSYLSPEFQEELITSITDREASVIIDEMHVDDAVDALDELPANVVQRLLQHTSQETRQTINHFLNYPDTSAGSIMTTEFVRLQKEMTVGEAFDRIRQVGLDSETVYTCYVTDANHRMEGVITVRQLFLSSLDVMVGDVMDTEVIFARTTDDQVEIAQTISKYDFLCLPVLDHEDRLVGIVTVDDVIDVIQEENTEDFEIMAAISPSNKAYLRTGVIELAKNRFPWLLFLMVSAYLTGGILGHYEEAFVVMPILVQFIPLLMDTGGNSGAQSSTMVIRGIALGEIDERDAMKILWKETRVSLLVGVLLAFVNTLRLLLINGTNPMVGLTISATLVVVVSMSNVIGGLLPIIAKKFNIDPAIMAAPLITTMVDAGALIVYFNFAHLFLGL